jgi:hypothetical protein
MIGAYCAAQHVALNKRRFKMGMRKGLWAGLAGGMFALGSSGAMAFADCSTITTILQWETAVSCTQGDKTWTLNSDSLADAVVVTFTTPNPTSHLMVISQFDNSDAPGAWAINYTITVTDPNFRIAEMAAGADVTGGATADLTKDVTGDAAFQLKVINGAEGPGSTKTGLSAKTLTVDEKFTAAEFTDFNSVSDSFKQKRVEATVPGTLALLGLGLVALGAVRRKKSS